MVRAARLAAGRRNPRVGPIQAPVAAGLDHVGNREERPRPSRRAVSTVARPRRRSRWTRTSARGSAGRTTPASASARAQAHGRSEPNAHGRSRHPRAGDPQLGAERPHARAERAVGAAAALGRPPPAALVAPLHDGPAHSRVTPANDERGAEGGRPGRVQPQHAELEPARAQLEPGCRSRSVSRRPPRPTVMTRPEALRSTSASTGLRTFSRRASCAGVNTNGPQRWCGEAARGVGDGLEIRHARHLGPDVADGRRAAARGGEVVGGRHAVAVMEDAAGPSRDGARSSPAAPP